MRSTVAALLEGSAAPLGRGTHRARGWGRRTRSCSAVSGPAAAGAAVRGRAGPRRAGRGDTPPRWRAAAVTHGAGGSRVDSLSRSRAVACGVTRSESAVPGWRDPSWRCRLRPRMFLGATPAARRQDCVQCLPQHREARTPRDRRRIGRMHHRLPVDTDARGGLTQVVTSACAERTVRVALGVGEGSALLGCAAVPPVDPWHVVDETGRYLDICRVAELPQLPRSAGVLE